MRTRPEHVAMGSQQLAVTVRAIGKIQCTLCVTDSRVPIQCTLCVTESALAPWQRWLTATCGLAGRSHSRRALKTWWERNPASPPVKEELVPCTASPQPVRTAPGASRASGVTCHHGFSSTSCTPKPGLAENFQSKQPPPEHSVLIYSPKADRSRGLSLTGPEPKGGAT